MKLLFANSKIYIKLDFLVVYQKKSLISNRKNLNKTIERNIFPKITEIYSTLVRVVILTKRITTITNQDEKKK